MHLKIIEELELLTESLTKEFCEIRDHPRVLEIFEGLYIYDSSLPIPSKDFILMVTYAVLRDAELLQILEKQAVGEGRQTIVAKFTKSNDAKANSLAEIEARRRLIVRHLYSKNDVGDGAADWNELVHHFRHGFDKSGAIWRSVSQRAIDLQVARAILLSDFKSLEGLARATKESHFSALEEVPQPARHIVSHILWCQPMLQEHLEWDPSKEAIKLFILTVYSFHSESPTTWANAWKMLPHDLAPKHGSSKLTESRRGEILKLAARVGRERNTTEKRPGL